jgi:hypothetical protein
VRTRLREQASARLQAGGGELKMRIVRYVEISTTQGDGVEQVRNVNERGILTFLTGVFVGEI